MGATFSRISKQRVITTRSQLDEEINLFLNNETRPALSTNPMDEQYDQLISSFLEISVGQTVETATSWFLETTNWDIDEAINLFLLDNNHDPSMYHDDKGSFFEGSFQDAKSTSSRRDLWLLVNLQSRTEFASHTLNRDVWSNEAVSETVESRFMLWQVYDHTIEGQKLSNFYKIECSPPVVLVIDPITGQKMRMWSGEIEAHSFVEDLMRFTEDGPHQHISSLIRNRHPETNEELHIGSSRNNTYQVPAPSWGEEFEKEDTWSSSNNIDQIVAPSWGEEFEKEDTLSSSNNIDKIVAPLGEEFENVETWSSSNNYDHIVTPSWGPEFEESAQIEKEEESGTCIEFPDLTEEPKGDCDRSLVCSLCVRFPDGRRKQRRFLKSEPIQLLWSFCYSQMERS